MKWSRLKDLVGESGCYRATVLYITGENGTGKELLAEDSHRLSGEQDVRCLRVDMGLSAKLSFEKRAIRTSKRAFTGAVSIAKGKVGRGFGQLSVYG